MCSILQFKKERVNNKLTFFADLGLADLLSFLVLCALHEQPIDSVAVFQQQRAAEIYLNHDYDITTFSSHRNTLSALTV